MEIKKLTCAVIALFFSAYVLAQTPNITYYKNNGREVKLADSADFTRIIGSADSGSALYSFKEIYKNGIVKQIGKTSKPTYLVYEGVCISYYPTGEKKEIAYYINGRYWETVYRYYPNGILYTLKRYVPDKGKAGNAISNVLIKACYDSTGKALITDGNGHYVGYNDDFRNIGYNETFKSVFEEGDVKDGLRQGNWKGGYGDEQRISFTETYENGKLVKGQSVGTDGITYSYTAREVEPQYPGGAEKFYSFLSNKVKYPKAARKAGISGRVLVVFVVEKDGSLTDVKAVRAPSPELGDESVRAVMLSPKWIPGLQFGRPVRVQYTIPINFNSNNSGPNNRDTALPVLSTVAVSALGALIK